MSKLFRAITAMIIISTLLAACSSDEPTATDMPLPTLEQAQDKAATTVPPTDTPVIASATPKATPTDTPAPLTAERLVEECAKAMGGVEKIDALETLRTTQRWPDHGLIRYEIKRPNYVRMGDDLVFDGERASWLEGKNPPGTPRLVPQQEWKDYEMDIAWYVPAFFDYPAEYMGTEMVDNIETYKLQVTLSLGAVMTYNLDAQTYLVYRAASDVVVGEQEYHYERIYSDYRLLDGILYPHAFTYAGRDGVEVLTATMVKLEFNAPLEDERFAVPATDSASVAFTKSAQTLGDTRPFGLVIADIDLDNDNDIFFPNYIGPSKLWLNDGNGVFADSRQRFSTSETHDAAIQDLNGDTWPDIFLLAHATPSKVYFNDGSGGFTDSGQNIGSVGDDPGMIVLGDVDNDGDSDAFISHSRTPNRLWLNDGTGFFSITDTEYGGRGKSYDMALMDFNGDTFLDLFLTMNDQADQVWINDGSGNFINSGQALGSQAGDDHADSRDVDGDGDNDVVVANNVEGVKVWLNQDNSGVFVEAGPYFGDSAWHSRLFDADLDGDFDLIMTHLEGGNELWLNDGSESFTSIGPIFGSDRVLSVACGKLDADDDYDVVLGKIEGTGGNTIYFNTFLEAPF